MATSLPDSDLLDCQHHFGRLDQHRHRATGLECELLGRLSGHGGGDDVAPLSSTLIVLMTSPCFTALTVPASWLRVLSLIGCLPASMGMVFGSAGIWDATVPTRAATLRGR